MGDYQQLYQQFRSWSAHGALSHPQVATQNLCLFEFLCGSESSQNLALEGEL
jgi:hypothetical protein